MIERPVEVDTDRKPSKAWLEAMYWGKQYSMGQIAKIIGSGCYPTTIQALLKRHDIPIRKLACIDRNLLEQLYVCQQLSVERIAAQVSKSPTQVRYALHVHRIPLRGRQRKPRPTREWLMQKHFEEKIPWTDIKAQLGFGDGTFQEMLKEYDIPVKQYVPVSE